MRTGRIIELARRVSELEEALFWLEEFGPKATASDAINISVRLNFAGSCRGAKEAAEVIQGNLSNASGELVSVALVDCRNTLEILKSQILEEASK